MKKSLISIAFIFTVLLLGACTTESETLESPNKEISIQLKLDSLGEKPQVLFYKVNFNGKNVVVPSPIHFTIDDAWGAENLEILNQSTKPVHQTWQRTWGKNKDVVDNYNEYIIDARNSKTEKKLQFIFRLYNDGIAFRYCIPEGATQDSFNLTRETSGFNFADNHTCWGVDFSRYYSAQEKEFEVRKLDHIKDTSILGIPLVVEVNKQAYVAIAEANLTDWAGMFLKKANGANTLRTSLFPRRDLDNVLVRTKGKRYSPWRVLMIGDNLGDLVETDIISNLNEPCAIENTDWIKPGKSAWDWWWSNSYAPDADFKLGPNNETMKYFIDLAAEMGWEYQLVDWHWYGEPFTKMPKVNPEADITTPNPNIDIPELVEYGKKKGVGILVWLHWESAKNQMDEAFPLYEKWGVKGVKVDFMNREDQQMVNFYHKLVKKAAEHQLLVDFHGAYKPTGWTRTYPNLVTREGILGNEYNKWSTRISLEHTVLIPFTRGLLGELDFTPGGYYNVHDEDFKTERKSICPNVRGTRCHQLAMNVVYESVLQIMCGAPFNYRTYPQGNDFLSIVPTTWDETRFVDGYPGDLVCIARRSGSDWFIGGMTDEQARSISFKFDFLDEGKYTAKLWSDDQVASEEDPKNLKKTSFEVVKNQSINIEMIRGGGFVMHLKKHE